MFADRYGGRWFLQERNQRSTRRYTLGELMQRFRLDSAKPTAVVFSQVLWDANLFYGDDLFEDAGEWFVETVRAACANPALNWLIKLHPANFWKRKYEGITQEYAERVLIDQAIGVLPAHVTLIAAEDDISTLSLFESIDYGVTVRGTSGMEMVCFGKHCVTAGTGRFSELGFTLDSTSREQYLQRLAHLHTQPAMNDEEVLRAKWHAYAAFALRPWPMLSAKAEFMYRHQGRDPMDHNLRLAVASLDELNSRGDLAGWADWAEAGGVDYIQHCDRA
jgi:capsule polysaccharide export protein KpsC/LpsZ